MFFVEIDERHEHFEMYQHFFKSWIFLKSVSISWFLKKLSYFILLFENINFILLNNVETETYEAEKKKHADDREKNNNAELGQAI